MFRLLCLFCLAGVALADNVVLNQVIDQALAGLNAAITQAGKAVIPMSELKEDWKYRWHFVHLSGHVHCWGGIAENLASIRRTGDVVMTTNGNQITLKIALGLGSLSAHYDHCQAKAKHLFSVTQHVSTSVSSNSIEAQATLTKNGNQCTAHLDFVRVANLGKININTGGGVLHKIEDHLLKWIGNKYHGEIVNVINQVLQEQATANFPKADLCNKIPH